MKYLKIYTKKYLSEFIRQRSGEIKLGECVQTLLSEDLEEGLLKSSATFVLIGLPEDIGVRANLGQGGTQTAWESTLINVLNVQENEFLNGEKLLILGHIDFTDLMNQSEKLTNDNLKDITHLRELCTEIDIRVTDVVKKIVTAKKIPIIIGGGHNNSYSNIKGAALGLKANGSIQTASINCINCDAHSDFRALEGRHSGNGFSYAFDEKFLSKYFIVGLHENYNSGYVLTELKKQSTRIRYQLFEDIFIDESINLKKAVEEAVSFCDNNFYGLELDMDSIENIPSSAKTPSGISANQARQYVTWGAQNKKVAYLHLTEAAPILSPIKAEDKTGKLIAYLVTDFMKAYLKHTSKELK